MASLSPLRTAVTAALVSSAVLATFGCDRARTTGRVSDPQFWALLQALSEQPRPFALSENLVSNEREFADVARSLRPQGGVYIGVGPEQNFTYIAALQPTLAFIVDIRRENRSLHLLYKALFELSSDRVEFVSRLFSRLRPAGLSASSSVDVIFAKFDDAPPSSALQAETMALVRDRLLVHHGFPLSSEDLEDIAGVLEAFRTEGPEIDFWHGRLTGSDAPSYRLLMTRKDWTRVPRSYLATHEAFSAVKGLQEKNLIVPVVGDFAGPTALRRIGDHVRARSDVIRAFYASNVGVYLTNAQMRMFCGNLATLPVASGTLFIESKRVRPLSARLGACRDARGDSLVFELPADDK